MGYALNSGRGTAFSAVAGAVAGNVITLMVSLAGVGTVLEAFPRAYRLVELVGAVYLVALGLIGILRSRPPATELWPNLGDGGLREAAYRGG